MTIRAYCFELNDFGRHLELAGVERLMDISRQTIEAWQDDTALRKKVATQQLGAAALRSLLRWAEDRELQLSSPTLWLRVTTPSVPARQPRPIPQAQLKALQRALDAPEPTSDLPRLRTRALFWVLYSSGCRIKEALQLTRTSFDNRSALVIQKGHREHRLVISGKADEAIRDYLRSRNDSEHALFMGYMDPRRPQPIGPKGVQEEWDRLAKELGIARFSSHQLRHSCASQMLRNGVDVLVVAKHLGHRDIRTIANYAEVALEQRVLAVAALGA